MRAPVPVVVVLLSAVNPASEKPSGGAVGRNVARGVDRLLVIAQVIGDLPPLLFHDHMHDEAEGLPLHNKSLFSNRAAGLYGR